MNLDRVFLQETPWWKTEGNKVFEICREYSITQNEELLNRSYDSFTNRALSYFLTFSNDIKLDLRIYYHLSIATLSDRLKRYLRKDSRFGVYLFADKEAEQASKLMIAYSDLGEMGRLEIYKFLNPQEVNVDYSESTGTDVGWISEYTQSITKTDQLPITFESTHYDFKIEEIMKKCNEYTKEEHKVGIRNHLTNMEQAVTTKTVGYTQTVAKWKTNYSGMSRKELLGFGQGF